MCVGEGEGSRSVQRVKSRESIDGWPMLTAETEVNGDSKSTQKRGSSLVGSSGLSCRYKIFLFSLGIIFLTVHFSNSFVPIAQQAGQAAVLGRLSLIVSLHG